MQRGIHGLVVCYLIVNIGLIEVFPAELRDRLLICRLLAQCLAGVVIFRGDAELFYQRQCFFVHRFVISLHVGRENNHVLVFAFLLGLFGSFNVKLDRP